MKEQSAPRRRGGRGECFLQKNLRAPPRLRGVLVALIMLTACRKAEPPKAKPRPGEIQIETPLVNKALDAADGSTEWLSGTWQKQGAERWFLFNLPSDVAELAGKPPHVVRRGRLVVHGRFVDAIFPTEEMHFKASSDRSEMQSDGTYRRGAPP